jgi:hypothetical protein
MAACRWQNAKNVTVIQTLETEVTTSRKVIAVQPLQGWVLWQIRSTPGFAPRAGLFDPSGVAYEILYPGVEHHQAVQPVDSPVVARPHCRQIDADDAESVEYDSPGRKPRGSGRLTGANPEGVEQRPCSAGCLLPVTTIAAVTV